MKICLKKISADFLNCRYKKYKLHKLASFFKFMSSWLTYFILVAQTGTFWGEEVLTRMGTI